MVGIFSPTNKVSAQLPTDLGTCTRMGPENEPIVEKNVQRSTCPNGFGQSFQQNSPSGASPVADPGATEIGLKADANCSVFGNLGDCISSIFARIAWLIMTMMSWLLWLAGVLLNYVIKETVLTMKEGVDKMKGINIGWKVIRDIMNIGFIFLLVYEGILMIIGQSGKEKVKKFIFSIVLAALLINFSLFFTKVLIDASNIVTIGLYNSMIDSSAQSGVPGGDSSGDVIERPVEGISAPFMQALNLQQLYGGNSFDNISEAVGGGTNMLIFFLMGSVLFLILAFVFFAISMMFIVRYITLLILLMTSPVAYMGSAIPGMSTYSKQWWDSLKGQLLFAPIYMLITMVVLKLIESDNFIKTEGAEWAGFVNNASSTATVSGAATNSVMSLLLNFAVIIGLAIASLVIAKTSATRGSGYIKEATGRLTAFAGGAVMGGTAWAGRRTVGRTADRLVRSEKFQEYAGKSAVVKSLFKGTQAVAGSTFDARNTGAVKTTTGSLGVNLGKGSDKTFGKTMEAQTKAKTDFAKSLDLSKAGRESYAKGLAGGGLISQLYIKGGSNKSKRSLLGALGRDDRMAAATILGDRLKELRTEQNGYRNEINEFNRITNPPPPAIGATLTPTEQDRFDQLTGAGIYTPGATPGGPVGGLIQKASDDAVDLKRQIDSLELKNTLKQKY